SPWAFESILRVNLVAVATLCRLAIPQMLTAGHGSIVNISSRAAELATPPLAAYAASQGGLHPLPRPAPVVRAPRGTPAHAAHPAPTGGDAPDPPGHGDRRRLRGALSGQPRGRGDQRRHASRGRRQHRSPGPADGVSGPTQLSPAHPGRVPGL